MCSKEACTEKEGNKQTNKRRENDMEDVRKKKERKKSRSILLHFSLFSPTFSDIITFYSEKKRTVVLLECLPT